MKKLKLYCLYKYPLDFPEHFVVREFYFYEGNYHPASEIYFLSVHLEDVKIKMRHFHFLERNEDDDPKILGTYI